MNKKPLFRVANHVVFPNHTVNSIFEMRIPSLSAYNHSPSWIIVPPTLTGTCFSPSPFLFDLTGEIPGLVPQCHRHWSHPRLWCNRWPTVRPIPCSELAAQYCLQPRHISCSLHHQSPGPSHPQGSPRPPSPRHYLQTPLGWLWVRRRPGIDHKPGRLAGGLEGLPSLEGWHLRHRFLPLQEKPSVTQKKVQCQMHVGFILLQVVRQYLAYIKRGNLIVGQISKCLTNSHG